MDVAVERDRVDLVVQKINAERTGHRQLHLIRWEDDYYKAEETFQQQIDTPSQCDIVLCIFWKRLGTELPETFARNDGTIPTGTEYEFEDAMQAALEHAEKLPDVLVYRKMADVTFAADAFELERAQYERFLGFWRRWFHNEKGHFVAAFQTFEDPDEFERLTEAHIRAWLADRNEDPNWTQGSPYRGLQPFDVEHAPVFFGRRRETERTRARLIASGVAGHPFLMVTGASGSGKSSMVRAGLIPRLKQIGGLSNLGAALRYVIVTPSQLQDDWSRVFSGALFGETALEDELTAGDFPQPAILAAQLARADASAVGPLIRALQRAGQKVADEEQRSKVPKVTLLICIDQFEEIFLWSRQQAEAFLSLLSAMVEAEDQPFLVVATMRSDFRHRLTEYPALARLTGTGDLVGPEDAERIIELNLPSAADLREMILRPAAAAGLHFENRPGGRDLADMIERDARPEAMPAVQFLLAQLYEKRNDRLLTLAAYDELKGVAGVMAQTGEAIFQELDESARKAFPRVVRALVAKARRDLPAAARRVREEAFDGDAAARRLIERLVAARLVVADRGTFKFAHDSVFLGWDRLREQIEEEERLFEARERLEAYCREWLEGAHGRPPRHKSQLLTGFQLSEGRELLDKWGERGLSDTLPQLPEFIRLSSDRETRTRRLTMAAAWTVAAIFAGLSVAIYQQWWQAEEARKDAQAALLVSHAQSDLRDNRVKSALTNARAAFDMRPNAAARSVFLSSILEVDPRLVGTLRLDGGEVGDLAWRSEREMDVAIAGGRILRRQFGPGKRVGPDAGATTKLPKRERAQEGNEALVVRALPRADGGSLVVWDDDHFAVARDGKVGSAETAASAQAGGEIRTVHPSAHAVAYVANKGLLATAAVDGPVHVYQCDAKGDRANCSRLTMASELTGAQSVAFDPSGARLAVGHDDGAIRLLDVASGQVTAGPQLPSSVIALAWHSDGTSLAAGTDAGEVVLLSVDAAGLSERLRLKAPDDTPISAVAWRPDGDDLAYACARRAVCVLRGARSAGKDGAKPFIMRLEGHDLQPTRLAWAPSGQLLASAAVDEAVHVWSIGSASPATQVLLAAAGNPLRTVAVSKDGTRIAAGADNGALTIWNLSVDKKRLTVRPKDLTEVQSLSWSGNGQLAAVHESGAVTLVGPTGAVPRSLPLNVSLGKRITWIDNKTLAAPLRDDGRTALISIDAKEGREPKFLDGLKDGEVVWGLVPGPAAKSLYVDYTGGGLFVWDLAKRTSTGPMKGLADIPDDESGAGSLATSANGKWLARSGGDKYVRVYDIASGIAAFAFEMESNEPAAVAFSREGERLAALGSDDRVYIWDLAIPGQPQIASFDSVPNRRGTGTADAKEPHAAWIDWLPNGRLAVAARSPEILIVSLDDQTWVHRLDSLGNLRSVVKK